MHRFASRNPKPAIRSLASRLVGLIRQLCLKLCPWYPGEFPELDSRSFACRRPPAAPRHRFGRRNAREVMESDDLEGAETKKKPGLLVVMVPGSSSSSSSRE
jgi:hypothetical protein